MKKLIIIIIATLLSKQNYFAQDTLIKYSGDKLLVKVLEITATEIKYKKYEFQDGPAYVDNKFDIQQIRFANGVKEYFERAPKPAANNDYRYVSPGNFTPGKITTIGNEHYFMNGAPLGYTGLQRMAYKTGDRKIMDIINKSKKSFKHSFFCFGFFPCAIASVTLIAIGGDNSTTYNPTTHQTVSTPNPDQKIYYAVGALCGALAITCPIYGFWQRHNCVNYNEEAIKLYNQRY